LVNKNIDYHFITETECSHICTFGNYDYGIKIIKQSTKEKLI